MAVRKIRLKVTGMDCAGCADALAGYLRQDSGIREVKIDWHQGMAEVLFDPAATTVDQVVHSRAFSGRFCAQVLGPRAALAGVHHSGDVCAEAL